MFSCFSRLSHVPAVCVLGSLALCCSVQAQNSFPGRAGHVLTQPIDETRLTRLPGNTHPEAIAENDRGAAAATLALDHMLLQLQRTPAQEAEVKAFVDAQHDPHSPLFHQWLTAAQFGERFGVAQQDIETVTSWLKSHGFSVNSVYPSGMVIDFSGTAAQVDAAFHTSIHHFNVNGAQHLANVTDPQIPEALAPVIAGVVSMHDFFPHPMRRMKAQYTYPTSSGQEQAVVPADLAAIYNLNPLFNAGYTGKGQTIAVLEDTNLYSSTDWSTFRSTFGLSKYAGTLTTIHPTAPSGRNNCSNPGIVAGDDGEAALDAEWSSAAAPDAAIQVASCANTRTTFGGLIAMENMINSTSAPTIISISYGNCEADQGAAANSAFSTVYQQAVSQGIAVFVSAGDEGAASCDAGNTAASHGIGVSGWATTPYNVAVGGTDFGDSLVGSNSAYWNSTNSSTYGSAVSYIPEIPWNDSCASTLLANSFGYSTPFGISGFCNSSVAKKNQLVNVVAGSGGPSSCASGTPATTDIVGGSCQGVPKPSWQAGVAGIPSDGVRDIPDISLFAADGVYGHYYVTCWSDRANGGAPCTGSPSNWAGAGGTSFSAPILAGVQAIINQKMGSLQGNPNPVYYKLAAMDGAMCDASQGETSGCIFHNVTQGDISVVCGGGINCYGATAGVQGFGGRARGGNGALTDGVLSVSSGSYQPAFTAGSGWNFATGLGSINAYNLVMNYSKGQ